MNEILFECTYTDSEELLREAYSKVQYKGKVDLGRCLIVFSVCVFALAIVHEQAIWHLVAGVLLCGGVYCLLLPTIYARRVMDMIKRANHGNVPSATITMTDKITHQYKLNTGVMLYADLRVACFLKHSIVLWAEDAHVTFDRKGFTKGTPEELEKFLREKYPHVEIINKR